MSNFDSKFLTSKPGGKTKHVQLDVPLTPFMAINLEVIFPEKKVKTHL